MTLHAADQSLPKAVLMPVASVKDLLCCQHIQPSLRDHRQKLCQCLTRNWFIQAPAKKQLIDASTHDCMHYCIALHRLQNSTARALIMHNLLSALTAPLTGNAWHKPRLYISQEGNLRCHDPLASLRSKGQSQRRARYCSSPG